MTEENLKKSIILIGPACVGKSLLSSELSNRLGYDLICLDEILAFATDEMKGYLSPNSKIQEKYINDAVTEFLGLDDANPDNEEVVRRLVQKDLDNYNRYIDMFGSFSQFKDLIVAYDSLILRKEIEAVYSLNDVSYKVLERIFNKIDRPVIIDPPGCFGLFPSKDISVFAKMRLRMGSSLNTDVDSNKLAISKLLRKTQSVALFPGQDFDKRDACKDYSTVFEYILKEHESFGDYAKLMVSTNGLFNEPDNEVFKIRQMYNPEEMITKERLKNKCEIDNICDQIMESFKDLSMEE